VPPHYLDQIPLDFSDPAVRELRSLLSSNYFSAEVIAMVRGTGATPASINWNQPMALVWDDVLLTLQKQGKLRDLLQGLIDGPDQALAVRLRELMADHPVTAAPSHATDDSRMPPLVQDGLRKNIRSESVLLDVAFLQRGIELASAVVRLLVTLDGNQFFGTAFRIGSGLLLTCHHVLFADLGSRATAVEAWFGYERSLDGLTKTHISIPGRVDTIVGDPAHNWAVIRLAGPVPEGTAVISLIGAAPVKVDDRVYIIQHPYGGVKKIGMIHNVVRYVDDDVVRYLTDTEAGSSGSPVFNEQWQLVALHERWLWDNTGTSLEYRKQGRRIERVVDGLNAAGIE
jgi:endonuclease G